jgi:hypothetical protein
VETIPAPKTPVFVLEGDVRSNVDLPLLKDKFVMHGITNVLLCLWTVGEKKDISDPDVVEYRSKAALYDCALDSPFYAIDHIYCSTIQEEIESGVTIL